MHKHMLLGIEEATELTSLKEKITYIIPTSTAPINCLLWSVFSLLLRTRPDDIMEHFCVCINGPDKRTGDPTLQDRKQSFLEELRRLKWYHPDHPKVAKDMPLTVIRVWSRVGHPQALETAIPWVHTDTYVITHDDIILLDPLWTDKVRKHFYAEPKAAIGFTEPLLCAVSETARLNDKNLLRFPHMLTTFLVCRKKWMNKLRSTWIGYHVELDDFTIEDLTGNAEEFIRYHSKFMNDGMPPRKDLIYNYISMEIGALYFQKIRESKELKIVSIGDNIIKHLGVMSWGAKEDLERRVGANKKWISSLEQEIYRHPEYAKLYEKYKTP